MAGVQEVFRDAMDQYPSAPPPTCNNHSKADPEIDRQRERVLLSRAADEREVHARKLAKLERKSVRAEMARRK
eukprot:7869263-Karenia_brevis.AAC.1